MIALASFFIVIVVLLLIARVASVALVATGMPGEVARFQARSALTGVGFTTSESESVVNHPVRRRILMALMLIGNAGLVTLVASLAFSFAGAGGSGQVLSRLAVVVVGLIPIAIVTNSKSFERQLGRLIARALARWSDLEVRDMVHLMQLTRDYAVSEVQAQPGDWIADRYLSELRLPAEGVLVLGVLRADGSYIGAPRGQTKVHSFDTLILYGRTSVLSDLDSRSADLSGAEAHEAAIAEYQQLLTEESGESDGDSEAG